MYYNYLNAPSISRNLQSSFSGLNKNARIGESEFSDMRNMSSDHLPLLAPRKMRYTAQKQISETVTETVTDENGKTSEVENTEYKRLNGILGDVGFCAVWGNDFYYMGERIDGISLIDGEKKLVAMGGHILVFPDTVYYNTINGEYGQMETGEIETGNCVILTDRGITLADGTVSGEDIAVEYVLKPSPLDDRTLRKIPLSPAFGAVSATGIMEYPNYTRNTLPVRLNGPVIEYLASATVAYVSGTGAGIKVRVKDDVWKPLPIKSVQLKEVPELSAVNNLWYGDNHIVISGTVVPLPVPGNLGSVFSKLQYTNIGNEIGLVATYAWRHKNLPVLDFVCVHDNRLWGCRYGMQVTGGTVNEIYCSALGDFKTWTVFQDDATLAGSAYAASVGDYGAFTGCISHRGYVLFFKEDVMYRVSGTKPANFQISKISASGVQEGCEKSMEIIDGILYYKSRNGVYAYDGSLPQKISSSLGEGYYTDAVAGSLLSKYYITMMQSGKRCMFVYDTRYGIWHAEDDIDVRFFTEYDGALYGGVDNSIMCLAGNVADIFDGVIKESDFNWYAESGDIGLSSPYQKYYHRLLIRMDIEMGARVKVEIAADGGDWLVGCDFTAPGKRTFVMPVVTPRCDHMRFRISGKGDAKIYSISFETETVGDKP